MHPVHRPTTWRSSAGMSRSRSGLDLTAAYPELGELSAVLAGHDAVLDGEIVAFLSLIHI